MKEGRQIDPEKISMLSLKTKKGSIEEGENPISRQINGYTFNFQVGTGMRLEEQIIGIELGIEIIAIDDSKKPIGAKGSYTHEIIFRVENLEDFIEKSEDGSVRTVDVNIISTLMGVSYSTIRGIIFTRTQGTSLGAVLLPVIDPKKLTQLATR